MPGDVLDRTQPDQLTDLVCETTRGDAPRHEDARREEAVETLRYALHGLLSAVRADRALVQRGPDEGADGEDASTLHTARRHRVLAALADELDLDAEGLAVVVGVAPPEARTVLDDLGRAGLVEAVRPGRGRGGGTVARLTPAGLRELDDLDNRFRSHWEGALADLPHEELRTAARVLSRLSGVFVPGS